MPDSTPEQTHKQSLTVLPHSGKVDQLKREAAGSREPPVSSEATTAHVNRTRPNVQRPAEQQAVERKVIEALRTVYDPEIPINIYELGLVYDIDIDAENRVQVRMTLTAPACPV